MKKYLYKIVFATLILISATVVNASNEVYYINKENVIMTEEEYNNLKSLGFTERYIERMDQEEFLNNKDLKGSILGETQKYLRRTTRMRNGIKTTTVEEITKEEAMKDKELQSQNGFNKGGAAGNYYRCLHFPPDRGIFFKKEGFRKENNCCHYKSEGRGVD